MRRFFSSLMWLLKLAVFLAAVVWLYLNPGTIQIDWQGYTIDTSVGFAAAALAVTLFTVALLYHGWRTLLGWPHLWRKQRALKAHELGYKALNRGLLAVASGDRATARKQADKAVSLLPDMALTHLLAAQAAQLNDDDAMADTHLAQLAQHPDGQLFGLRGQVTRALQRHDQTEALRLARVAYQQQPKQPWVIDTAVQMEARQQNWLAIEKILRQAITQRSEETPRWEKDLAATLLALSDHYVAKYETEPALDCAREALKRVPAWAPAAIRVADLWQRKAYRRRAQKVLTQTWDIQPHPDLVKSWLKVSGAERALDQAALIEKLVVGNPDHPESHLAMARANITAELWGVARQHAAKALDVRADRAAYKIMAEIEQGDTHNAARVREWLEKAADAPVSGIWECRLTHQLFDAWQPLNQQLDFNTITWTTPRQNSALLALSA